MAQEFNDFLLCPTWNVEVVAADAVVVFGSQSPEDHPWESSAVPFLDLEYLIGAVDGVWHSPGRFTHSILFCWVFTIKNCWKKWVFLTSTQSRLASVVVDIVLVPQRLARHTWVDWWQISEVPEATHDTKKRALKEHWVSSKSPSRDKHEESYQEEWKRVIFFSMKGPWLGLKENQRFFYKKQTEKTDSVLTWHFVTLQLNGLRVRVTIRVVLILGGAIAQLVNWKISFPN